MAHGAEPMKLQKSTAEPFDNIFGHILYNVTQNGFVLCGLLQTMSVSNQFYVVAMVPRRRSKVGISAGMGHYRLFFFSTPCH